MTIFNLGIELYKLALNQYGAIWLYNGAQQVWTKLEYLLIFLVWGTYQTMRLAQLHYSYSSYIIRINGPSKLCCKDKYPET